MASSQQEKAARFRAMHLSPDIFVLPNAWDVASAMIFILEGFESIGTTSAGIAASLGYADGQRMTFEANLEVIGRIVKNTDLPVSADFESGYSDDVDDVAKASLKLLRAGAVGLNIEDSPSAPDTALKDVSLQQEKIRAIRDVGETAGIPLLLNARTDTFLVGDEPGKSLHESIARGNAYVEAGADCVFVPDTGNLDERAIKALVAEVNAPINVIAGATMPNLEILQDMGVSRVSLGPRPMRVLLSKLRDIAHEIQTQGSFEQMSSESITYGDVNSWFIE